MDPSRHALPYSIVNGIIMQLIAGIFGQPDFDSNVIGVGDVNLLVGTVITALALRSPRRRDATPDRSPASME